MVDYDDDDSMASRRRPNSGLTAVSAIVDALNLLKSRRNEEEEKRKEISCCSAVDDIIKEFAPDDSDRERWRRRSRSKRKLDNVEDDRSNVRVRVSDVEEKDNSSLIDEGLKRFDDDGGSNVRVRVSDDDGLVVEAKDSSNLIDDGLKQFDDDVRSIVRVRVSDEDLVVEEKRNSKGDLTSIDNELKQVEDGKEEKLSANAIEDDRNLISEELAWETDYNGSLLFYMLDAHEENTNPGSVYLFGKVKAGDEYHSCCIVVKNMQRCVYAIPTSSVFRNELVSKLEKDAADKKISDAEFRSKLHDMASGMKAKIANHLLKLNVSTFTMAPVKRSYAFEHVNIPRGENYVLKINYPFKDPPLQSDLKGDTFGAVLGTHSSALELFLVKRKIMGPSWLSISKFSSCPSGEQVSWCKVEMIVECPKDIQVSSSTKKIPPVIVTAISLKTIINEEQKANEIVSASIISCSKAESDTPMPASSSEWVKFGVLNQFTIVRKRNGWSVKFKKEVEKRNTKAGSTILHLAESERALLTRLVMEIYILDSDVLVGHNICGSDLPVLFHRAKFWGVHAKTWSKIGRLRRKDMAMLTKGRFFCVAGRLLCDTFLSSQDLLKEVSYSLTQLAKTQLNKERKEIAPKDISSMYQSTESLMSLIDCNEADAWLSMELMFHLNILPLTRQLTNISGNLWGKTLKGARAQRVEYLLLHKFHAKKHIVPDRHSSSGKENKLTKRKKENCDNAHLNNLDNENEALHEDHGKGKKGSAYAGGLVLDPKIGLYDRYVLLLDFNSLYPSIIQEYNICFTTVERSPDGSIPCISSCNKTGLLPELLKNLVESRRMVKSKLKKASGIDFKQLNIRQQALKLTANSLYGCLGSPYFRFYAKPLAELITLRGREILQNTVDLVQNTLNLEVIYGDTDSIMIYTGLDDKAKAKTIAAKVMQEVNNKYRCLDIELDGIYKRILLLQKKKYAAVKVPLQDEKTDEVIEQKGLDMVRRDCSLLSKEVGENCLSQILSGGSREDVVESIHNSLKKVQEEMRKGEVPLEKYIITKTLKKNLKAYLDAENQPHVQVALRMKKYGYTIVSARDTVPYVICCEQESTSETSSGIAQRARHPDELKNNSSTWMIDINYYLSQQIHPVVSRLCAFINGTDPARLADCLGLDSSKFQSKSNHLSSNDPSSSLLCPVDDEDRYQGCEPLRLSCPSCLGTFDCPSIFSTLSKSVKEKPNTSRPEDSTCKIFHSLCCPKCRVEGGVGVISPAMIANQVKRQADGFISKYYRGLMTCDDETCKYTTRSLNLRVIGDSERGTLCPNYPQCNGHLVRKYSEVDLYKQLTYFCFIFDTVRCIDKVDASVKLRIEKELNRIQPMVESAAIVAQKLRDRCACGWVQLYDLCVTS